MDKKIFIASDHAGYQAKSQLIDYLKGTDFQVVDLGADTDERTDYPLYSKLMAEQIQLDEDVLGILICGSGIGICMAANRYAGVRAALSKTPVEARLARQHNNANVLCLDGRLSSHEDRVEIFKSWYEASFEGGRHLDRINMFSDLGEKIDSGESRD